MCNIQWMHIFDSFKNLFEHPPTLAFIDSPLRINILQILLQWYPINILYHKVDLPRGIDQLHHFDHIWVIEFLKHCYLTLNSFAFHLIVEFELFVNLQSVFLVGLLVLNETHWSVSSLANLLTDNIVVQRGSLIKWVGKDGRGCCGVLGLEEHIWFTTVLKLLLLEIIGFGDGDRAGSLLFWRESQEFGIVFLGSYWLSSDIISSIITVISDFFKYIIIILIVAISIILLHKKIIVWSFCPHSNIVP